MYVRIVWVCAVAPLCCISHTAVLHSNKSKSKSKNERLGALKQLVDAEKDTYLLEFIVHNQ